MDAARRQRYLDKLTVLDRLRRRIDEWTADATPDRLARDPRTQLAVYQALQEAIEAAMDLCAMRLRDSDRAVKDDYGNVDLLLELGDLPAPPPAGSRACRRARHAPTHASQKPMARSPTSTSSWRPYQVRRRSPAARARPTRRAPSGRRPKNCASRSRLSPASHATAAVPPRSHAQKNAARQWMLPSVSVAPGTGMAVKHRRAERRSTGRLPRL
jgi:hypothetical protein